MEIKKYVADEKIRLHEIAVKLHRKPHLVVVQVNDDPASNSYIRGKLKDADEIGFQATLLKLDVETSQDELLRQIARLNIDQSVDGLIVQLPLPKHISEDIIKLAVNPNKDVDGFHPLTRFKPCTPQGIIDYLHACKIKIVGVNALVIGRSNIVGKPMVELLTKENATVTVAHSKTPRKNLDFFLAHADIIVVAVGKPGFISTQRLKKNATIIDVGINKVGDHLVGDANANLPVFLQTPVPGGVGLLTRLRLMKNLLEAFEHGI